MDTRNWRSSCCPLIPIHISLWNPAVISVMRIDPKSFHLKIWLYDLQQLYLTLLSIDKVLYRLKDRATVYTWNRTVMLLAYSCHQTRLYRFDEMLNCWVSCVIPPNVGLFARYWGRKTSWKTLCESYVSPESSQEDVVWSDSHVTNNFLFNLMQHVVITWLILALHLTTFTVLS